MNAHFLNLDFLKINKIRFMENVKYNEDIIFIREIIYAAKSFSFNPEKLYIYRNNPSSITAIAKGRESVARCLAVVAAWEKAMVWGENCRKNGNQDLYNNWIKLCYCTMGAIVLEAVRLSAENGWSIKQIVKKYEGGYMAAAYNG